MAAKLRSFIVLFFLLVALPSHSEDRSIRIVGGTDVPDARYPWMAAIYERIENGGFFPICGGSLVSDRWIMSAAHCFFDPVTGEPTDASEIAFLLGSLDLTSDDGIFSTVSRVIVHPAYSPDAPLLNDIALLELSAAVNFPTITLPSPQNPVPFDGENSTVAGWGVTSEGGTPSALLQEADLPIVEHAACQVFYPGLNAVATVCAGGLPNGGRDSCQGDSGGPLFVPRGDQFVQAGIVSLGLGCARPGIPGVYTRVASYFDWISSFVGSTTVYDGANDNEVVAIPRSTNDLAANSRISAAIGEGGTDVYIVSGVNQITLNTIRGDADLFVFNSPVFSNETQVCSSFLVTAIDECLFDSVGDFYVAIAGFEDSDYSLTVSDGTQAITDFEIPVLQTDIAVNGNLQEGTTAVFRANSGSIATLTSVSGDADLFVFSDDEFNFDTLLCNSGNTGSALDSCTFGASNSAVYVMVFGDSDSSYSLVTSNTAPPVIPQGVPPQPEDTDFPPQPEDTDFPPQPEDTDFPPQPEDTDFPPQPEDTDLPPQPEDTEDSATSTDTPVVPQAETTNLTESESSGGGSFNLLFLLGLLAQIGFFRRSKQSA